jgi:hypothetical protein
MHLYVKKFQKQDKDLCIYQKNGIATLIWDISEVTTQNIIEFWKLYCNFDNFDILNQINKKDRKTICNIISNKNLPAIIDHCLNDLKLKKIICSINQDNSFYRLIYYLIAKTLGYITSTKKEAKTCEISCRDIIYWGSFGKAVKNSHMNVPKHHYFDCGCDLVPYSIQKNCRSRNSYNDDEVFYSVNKLGKCTIEFQYNPKHNQNIIKYILEDINVFPMDIIKLIISYL